MKVERRECSVIGQATQWPASMSLFGVHLGSEQLSQLAVAHVMEPQCRSSTHRQKDGGGLVAVTWRYTYCLCYTVNISVRPSQAVYSECSYHPHRNIPSLLLHSA